MNNNKALFVLFLIVFIDLIGFGIIIPLIPLYASSFGADSVFIAILVAVYPLMQFFFAPIWGNASDRYGRRPILVATLVGSVFAYIALGSAKFLWVVFFARALSGAMAGDISTAQAYIADITTPENRSRGMGMLGAAFGLGFIFGPAIGGLLATWGGEGINYQIPSFFAAFLSFVGLILAFTCLPESLNSQTLELQPSESNKLRDFSTGFRVFRSQEISLLVGIAFLISFAMSALETTLGLWAKTQFNWGPAQIGYLFGLMGIFTTVMQGGLIGIMTKRFGENKMLIFGLSSTGVGFLLVATATTLPLVIFGGILLGIGPGTCIPSNNSLISKFANASSQGETMGVAQSTSAFGRIVGPTWAGICFATFSRSAPFFSSAIAILIAVGLGLRVSKMVRSYKNTVHNIP
ncbi:MAG: MFS transporter [Cyanobacteria bacterium P01_A01_bin.84]